ncbi:hypothetical protein EBT31_13520 [bacterium]|nr:hypothetical protein [bacterium]
MAMQYDVKSTHLNASGSVYSGRARVKGFSICATASTAGTLLLKDGGSSGTTVIEVDIPANSNPNSFYTLVPGEGVLCATSIYASLTGIASVTVYYG